MAFSWNPLEVLVDYLAGEAGLPSDQVQPTFKFVLNSVIINLPLLLGSYQGCDFSIAVVHDDEGS